MIRFVFLAALLLAACDSVAPSPAADYNYNPAIAATNARAVLDSAGAQFTATVQRQIEMESTSDARTETAFQATLSTDRTQSAQTQAAISQRDTETANNATATMSAARTQAAAAVERENKAAADWLAWSNTIRNLFVILAAVIITSAVVSGLTVWFIIRERARLDLQRQRLEYEAQIERLKIEAMSRAVRETNAGTMIAVPGSAPMFLPPVQRGPMEYSTILSDAPTAPPITVNADYDSYTLDRLSADEIVARDLMLEWIELSIRWHDERGNRPGHRQHQLKRYNYIGKGSSWQMRVAALFGEALESSKAGSFSREGLDLGSLRAEVKAGRISPVLEQAKQTETARNTAETAV